MDPVSTPRAIVLSAALCAACAEAPPPAPALAIPSAPPPPSPPAAPPPKPPEAASPKPELTDGPLDLAGAPVVTLKASPLRAEAPKPIGVRPAKNRTLRETQRTNDASALHRAESHSQYDPSHPFDLVGNDITELPPGARRDIPLAYAGQKLRVISESGGKLLLVYGPRFVAIAGGNKVEQVLDMDPPALPLSSDDRLFSDVHQAVYADGVVYVCRGYNGWIASRKGYVTAVDAATGDMRWRSDAKTCGGVLALVDEYVITGYGAIDTPYALKLLRRHDGTVAQTLPLNGAAIELNVNGETVVAGTHKNRVVYALQP